MADGSLLFNTSIDQKGFKEGVAGLEGAAKKGLSVVAGLATAAGAAMLAIGTASIKVGMNFEASMSQVAATMGITVDEIANGSESFEILSKAAKDAGATTMFSASQSAEALNYLALAGYDATKAASALPTVLNLAAAGGLELAYASDLVTDSMSALGMESDQLEGFVDKLAKTSQKSNTNVAQLGEAILTVGGTAKIMAGGTTELSAQLGILADNGIKGAEGGTALRNVLLALSAPTQKQADQMRALGLEAYDANGNLRPTNEIFQDLNGQLETMTQQERTEVLNNLFNKVDLKSANALLASSGERFDDLAMMIDNADGAAESMAETLNDNLKGKMTILGSSMEGLGIQIYEGMEVPLKGAAEMAIDYVGQISKTLTAHDDIKASAEALGMTAEELGFDLSKIPNGIEGAFSKIGDILAEVLVKIAGELPKFIDMGKDMILNFLNGIKENREALMDSVVSILSSLLNAFFEIVPELFELGVLLLQKFLQGILQELPSLIDGALNMIDTLLIVFIDSLPLILNAGIEILLALVQGIYSYLPDLIDLAVMLMLTLVEVMLDNLPMIIETSVSIVETLLNGLTDKLPMILEMGLTMLMMLMDGIMDNAVNLIDAALEIINSLIDFILDNLDMIIDFTIKIIMAVVEGLIKNLDKLVDAALDLVDALITGITNNLPLIIDAGIRGTLALIDGLLEALPELINAAITLVVKLAQGIIAEIPRLIGVGLSAVGQLISGLIQAIPELLSAAGRLVTEALRALTNGFKGAVSIGTSLVEGIWEGITGAAGWLMGKIQGFADGVVSGIKGFFGIKSPAQKTRKGVGDELVHGVGAGVEDEMPELKRDVEREMEELASLMKSAVNTEIEGNLKIMSGSNALERGASTVTTNNNDNGVVQHITIVSPENTPSENARQLKKAQKELAYGY